MSKLKEKAKKKLRKEALKTILTNGFILSRFREVFEMYDHSNKQVRKEIKRMIKNHLAGGIDERDEIERFMDDVDDTNKPSKKKKNNINDFVNYDEDEDEVDKELDDIDEIFDFDD